MNTLSYHVVVRTPIGVRIGDISLGFDGEKVKGIITAPYFEPEVYGVINDDNTINVNLVVNVDGKRESCDGTGRISDYAIHISVPSSEFVYEIDGTATRAKTN